MLDIVAGTILVLIAAVVAVFLLLMAINVVLLRKLRSIIPASTRARPPVASNCAPDSDSGPDEADQPISKKASYMK
jgi:hypothetical protein